MERNSLTFFGVQCSQRIIACTFDDLGSLTANSVKQPDKVMSLHLCQSLCRRLNRSHESMQQQLAATLPEDAEQGRSLMLPGQTSEHLQGSVGAVLHLCAALNECCSAYVETSTDDKQLTKQFASAFATMGMFPALGAACASVAEALQQQQQLGVQIGSVRGASTYAEEAAQVLLWLVQRLCLSWPSELLQGECGILPAVQPAVTLAATVLQVCSTRLQQAAATKAVALDRQLGRLQDSSAVAQEAASSSGSSRTPTDNTRSSTTSSHTSSKSTCSSSPNCMSKSLLAARSAAMEVAKWLSLAFPYEAGTDAPEDSLARALMVSDNILELLLATAARVAYAAHKQVRGCSPASPPADDWNSRHSSSSSSSSGVTEGGALNRQQRRQQQRDQQRQQQRQMLLVPRFHQAALLAAGLTEADLSGSEPSSNLFGRTAEKAAYRILQAVCIVLGMRTQLLQQQQQQEEQQQQQVMLVEVLPPRLYPSVMLLFMELLALTPNLQFMRSGLDLLHDLAAAWGHAWPANASAAAGIPAAMAVTIRDGQRYDGRMLVQPLLQLMVPVAQHLLDSSAAKAAVLPATDAMVQQRVAVVSFLSHLLLSLLDDGTWIGLCAARRMLHVWLCMVHSTCVNLTALYSTIDHDSTRVLL
jgi:hypothetical protein